MAKTRSQQPDAASKRTHEAIDKLSTYYELGKRAIQLSNSTEGTYARGIIAQLVEETGENRATINKCRQFAEMYTPVEFKELCKLRRPDGKPIGWGHVTKLLTVPLDDRKLRVKLQTRAARDGWTARQLNDEIQGKYELVSGGVGRRWNLPTSTEQALRQIRQRSQQWLRWFDELENAKGISVATLPEDVQSQLKAVVREIRKLDAASD